jgi:hypothetical protein
MRIIGIVVVALIAACVVPQTGTGTGPQAPQATYAAPASHGTGVYINGQELSAQDKAQLDTLIGEVVPPGRYTVDAEGNAGPEGQPPVVNLYVLAQQREQGEQRAAHTDHYGNSGSMTTSGDCMMVSTPDVDFASSGC